mgnify:CR=1 FL=1
MKNTTYLTDEDRWQAVLARDPLADEQFVFAVQTTGIFCRPSCRARHALRKNVRFYPDAQHAVQDGFRPCKRCMPDKLNPHQQTLAKVEQACRLLALPTPALEEIGTDAAPDHESPVLAEFWEVFDFLLRNSGAKLNHARSSGLIAFNLPEVRAAAKTANVALPEMSELRRVLKASKAPQFVDLKPVNSRVMGGKTIRCWVFSSCSQQ